ncbi:LTA synthase family protein [Papillibacter cinnamivorans]|uniref:Sulfatase n=1 Tax=Papillibacter cinnamivorans DSM 12816 TaxID=1122930 RepID=A0A1W2AAU8_9FIRM|nr:alkaline phosphatase family protein [Papillibacter cinnamivorans]SMC57602.1 Sulfatase [Papillibacter cinnamivorans DSM 12816]
MSRGNFWSYGGRRVKETKREEKTGRTAPFWVFPAFFYGDIVCSELLVRHATGNESSGGSLLFLFLFSVPIALIFWSASTAFSFRANKRIATVLVSVTTGFFASQLVYYQIFHTFYITYSAINGKQILQFWREALAAMAGTVFPIALLVLPIVLLRLFGRKWKVYRRIRVGPLVAVVILAASIHGIAVGLVRRTGSESLSPYDLYFQTSYMDATAENFGLLTAIRLDIKRTVFGFEPAAAEPADSDAEATPTAAPPTETVYGYNVMDIDFDSLMASETNETLLSMDQYFSSLTPTLKNEKTGIYQGYNLILITAEAFSQYAIDEELMPTLYKMAHEGYYFPNFYTPVWGVSTSDGEYVACTGLIPKAGVWSFEKSANNSLPLVMGKQLTALGYSAYAYHDHTYTYYKRNLSHPNMGYIYKGVGNGLNVKKTWPESDLEMIDVTTPEYMGSEPFHAYYMTVSGHLQYNFMGNSMAYKNRQWVKDLPYSEACKAYLACNIELDRAMELLLQRLEEAGAAEHTIIAISADHYPYGLTNQEIGELAGHTIEENFELYRNAFILYVPGMTPETVEEPCCSMDILPTLSNLLGLEYDSRLLMGRDVFSTTAPLIIFNNRSWITDKGMYNAKTKAFTPTGDAEIPEGYVSSVSKIVSDKFRYSALILDEDYYAKVLPGRE